MHAICTCSTVNLSGALYAAALFSQAGVDKRDRMLNYCRKIVVRVRLAIKLTFALFITFQIKRRN